jgi:hypothetical protein
MFQDHIAKGDLTISSQCDRIAAPDAEDSRRPQATNGIKGCLRAHEFWGSIHGWRRSKPAHLESGRRVAPDQLL